MRSGTPQVFRVRLLVTASTASRRIDPCAELRWVQSDFALCRFCEPKMAAMQRCSKLGVRDHWGYTKKTVSDDWLSRVGTCWYTFLEASGVDLLVLSCAGNNLTISHHCNNTANTNHDWAMHTATTSSSQSLRLRDLDDLYDLDPRNHQLGNQNLGNIWKPE